MEFCPNCGSLLMPKKGQLECRCGYTRSIGEKEKEAYTLEERKKEPRDILIVEEEFQQMPVTKTECKKCGNTEAYYWMLQTRAGDEPATKFYRCTRCKHTWREYD